MEIKLIYQDRYKSLLFILCTARLNLVHFGFQQSNRNCIRHHRYSSRKWLMTWHQTVVSSSAYLSCNLPENMVAVNITVCTLKGHPYLQEGLDHPNLNVQAVGMEVRPFPSLGKKMREYIEERQALANAFSNRSFPSRPNPSPFASGLQPHEQRRGPWLPNQER